MAGGCIDIYTSRRTEHEKCLYWNRDEQVLPEEYALKHTPAGMFYAKEVSPRTLNKQIVSDFMFDENLTTLFTLDKIEIKTGDVVKYDEEYWNVIDCQRLKVRKQSQFMKNTSFKTYIQLKR